jgi:hypothetical protein
MREGVPLYKLTPRHCEMGNTPVSKQKQILITVKYNLQRMCRDKSLPAAVKQLNYYIMGDYMFLLLMCILYALFLSYHYNSELEEWDDDDFMYDDVNELSYNSLTDLYLSYEEDCTV